jgi:GNAT superfamily N-acetyltransferase
MSIIIRSANFPQDYAGIAAVLKAESPEWAATAEELAHEDAERDPQYHQAVFVAEEMSGDTPLIIGVAFVGHDTLAYREGKFILNLRVHPDWQGRGAGKALYQATLDHLALLGKQAALEQQAPLAGQELVADVWHAHPRTPRFLTERGFIEVWRRFNSYLDVAGFDFAPYVGLEERLNALGIEIKTYAELAADPDRLLKLYELDWAIWQDIPYGQPVAKRSLQQFALEEVNHPSYRPEACFIAVKEGEFIGYSNLADVEAGFDISMTGVLRSYRGQGVATLLKLYGIRYAQGHGNRRLWVVNDSTNTAMLALNAKLGFQRDGAMIRFVKRIA